MALQQRRLQQAEQRQIQFKNPDYSLLNGNVKRVVLHDGKTNNVYTNMELTAINQRVWQTISQDIPEDVLHIIVNDQAGIIQTYVHIKDVKNCEEDGSRYGIWEVIVCKNNGSEKNSRDQSYVPYSIIYSNDISVTSSKYLSAMICDFIDKFMNVVELILSTEERNDIPIEVSQMKFAQFQGLSDIFQVYLHHFKKTHLNEIVSSLISGSSTLDMTLKSISSVYGFQRYTRDNIQVCQFEGSKSGFDRFNYLSELQIHPILITRVSKLLRVRPQYQRNQKPQTPKKSVTAFSDIESVVRSPKIETSKVIQLNHMRSKMRRAEKQVDKEEISLRNSSIDVSKTESIKSDIEALPAKENVEVKDNYINRNEPTIELVLEHLLGMSKIDEIKSLGTKFLQMDKYVKLFSTLYENFACKLVVTTEVNKLISDFIQSMVENKYVKLGDDINGVFMMIWCLSKVDGNDTVSDMIKHLNSAKCTSVYSTRMSKIHAMLTELDSN